MDGVSAFASVLAIADVANKLNESFSKVRENNRKLRNLSKDVLAGLSDIQKFCNQRAGSLTEVEATELKDALDNLHLELSDAHRHCEKILLPTKRTLFGTIRASIKLWWMRSDIEAEVIRMKEKIQACHLRFISFTSARTEHSVLVLRQEHRGRLEQLDALFPEMLAETLMGGGKRLRSFNIHYTPDPIEINYLNFRVRQIISLYSQHANVPSEKGSINGRGNAFEGYVLLKLDLYSFDGYLAAITLYFKRMQLVPKWAFTKDAIRSLDTITSCVKRHTTDEVAIPLATCVLDCTDKVIAASEAQGTLAYSSFSDASDDASVSDPWHQRLIMTRKACANGFLSNSSLAWSLRQSSSKLRLALKPVEALRLARESLELQRAVPDYPDDDTLSWRSSGIQSLVHTSRQVVVRSLRQAEHDARCLRELALCLAACGCYADARVAGLEAVECFEALSGGNPLFQPLALSLKQQMVTWNSITTAPATQSLNSLMHVNVENTPEAPALDALMTLSAPNGPLGAALIGVPTTAPSATGS